MSSYDSNVAMIMNDQIEEERSSSSLLLCSGLGAVGVGIKDLTYCANNNRIVGGASNSVMIHSSSCTRSRIAMVNVITKIQMSLLIILFITLAGKIITVTSFIGNK